jgi:hypothetical protein
MIWARSTQTEIDMQATTTRTGTAFDDMDSDLGALAGETAVYVPGEGRNRREPREELVALHEEKCPKCQGSGRFRGFTGRLLGQCFTCQGGGKVFFKTSAVQRAKCREQAKAREERKQQEAHSAFAAEHPTEWAWMRERALRWDFARSMVEAVAKWGRLTDGQLAAVRKCIAKDAERAQLRAAEQQQRAELERTAQAVNIAAVEEAFQRAKDRQVNRPKLRLAADAVEGADAAEYVFSPAGENSRNAGSVYVTTRPERGEEGVYLGKIMGGKFLKVRDCSAAQEAQIVAVASNPGEAAKAYGQRIGACSVCGRTLTDGTSIDLGIGPICAERYGF